MLFFQESEVSGVVVAVEKIITSKLYEKSANRRIFSIDRHIGMAGSGLYADVRQLGTKKKFSFKK